MERQRICIAQLNPTVNDFEGNKEKILSAIRKAKANDANLVITPELMTVGYPAEDLLRRRTTLERNNAVLEEIRAAARENCISVLVGCLTETDGHGKKPLYNSGVLIGPDGEVAQSRHKSLLPTYDVFHEDRYYAEGPVDNITSTDLNGVPCGVTICEEVWADQDFWGETEYDFDPVQMLTADGAKVIFNISASPYSAGRARTREAMLRAMAEKHGATIFYANQVGGNTELLFDGNSMVIGPNGDVVARGASFEEDLMFVDIDENGAPLQEGHVEHDFAPDYDGTTDCLKEIAPEVLDALVLGLRDYCRKCGFEKIVIGLSGGIDSAVTAAIAVLAIGAENVSGITMPSNYSSSGSVDDSLALAANLGMECEIKPIEGIVNAFREQLGNVADVADENLQARARGTMLMGVSNREGRLLLTTGNKTELAVGYCTIYGDMNGGFSVLSDCPKMLVYALAEELNKDSEVIPVSTITKPASAELRPDQKDEDSLPPYPVLDQIVHEWVSQNRSFEQIQALGLPVEEDDLRRILRLIDLSEYKRRQAVPGLRVTDKSFGKHDRWFPIAAKINI